MNIAGYQIADLARLAACPLIGLVVLFVAKLISDRLTPFDDDHCIEEDGNGAYAMRRVGMYLALAFAIAGCVKGATREEFPDNLIWLGITSVVAAVLVGFCLLVGRRLTFPGLSMREAVASQNMAVGWVELGSRLAIGLIAFAAFQGEGELSDAVVFMLLAQLALVLSFYVYEAVTRYDMRAELKDANSAAGITVGGWMLSLGLILAACISGPSEDWLTDISLFGLWALFGLALLVAITWVGDWLFLPKSTSEQQVTKNRNLAAAGLLTGLNIGLAAIVASTIL